eukprot:Hpha_TRINITY_DN4235_c0_g1::TRINITY_DN4235_c0_g1_i2::g.186553::m.186553
MALCLYLQLDDKTRNTELDICATVGDLRKEASELFGLRTVRMSYGGKMLTEDAMPLADAGVCQESTVNLAVGVAWNWEEDWGSVADIDGPTVTVGVAWNWEEDWGSVADIDGPTVT